MIENFFEWYQKRIDELNIDPIFVWNEGTKTFDEFRKNAGIILYGDARFIFKRPNSKYFKNHKKEFAALPPESFMLDNYLCVTSELIAEKKYKAFKIMCGKHYMVEHNSEFYSISPNLLQGYADYCTLSEIMRDGYDEMPKESRAFRKIPYFSLKQILKKKKYFLRVMTEDCYEQYIKCLIASVFEFSDDEHYNNIIFCRNRGFEKFESVFVFDKESTVFNPMIAKGFAPFQTKIESIKYDTYSGKYIYCPGESIIDRFHELGRLIKSGVLEKKYQDFINELAQFDFCKVADEIYQETGFKVNERQIDMYRYGSEFAAETLEKQKQGWDKFSSLF